MELKNKKINFLGDSITEGVGASSKENIYLNETNLRGEGRKEMEVAPLSVYVDVIKEVAAYYALPVLDLYQMSGIQPSIPVLQETYCPDGLHPNDLGNRVIASRLMGFCVH